MELDDDLTLEDLLARLDPEEVSVLHRPGPVIVRISRSHSAPWVDAVAARIRATPVVTVLVGEPSLVSSTLAEAFDVCLTSASRAVRAPWLAEPVDAIEAAVAAQPLASLALVALLRANATSAGTAWDRIAAESAAYAVLLGSEAFVAWRAANPARARADTADGTPAALVTREGSVLHIELDRPTRRNALDAPMRDELVAALDLARTDGSITEVHLRGSGPDFCSGGDLDEFGTVGDPALAHAVRLTRHPGRAVGDVADRVTAHLHGACIGAGIEIPTFAHHVIAVPGTTIRLPELAMGLIPGAGGTVSILDRIGRQRTAWLALTGAEIDAATALAWGLVDEIVDPDEEAVGDRVGRDVHPA